MSAGKELQARIWLLESREIYEAAQYYRHFPLEDQKGVIEAYEAMKYEIGKAAALAALESAQQELRCYEDDCVQKNHAAIQRLAEEVKHAQ